jgi:hypothetical protein
MSNQGEDVLRLLKDEYVEDAVWVSVYWYFRSCIGLAMDRMKVYVIEYISLRRQKCSAKAEQISFCDFGLEPKESIQQRLDRYSRAWEILFNCLDYALIYTPYVTQQWMDSIWLEKLNLPWNDKF